MAEPSDPLHSASPVAELEGAANTLVLAPTASDAAEATCFDLLAADAPGEGPVDAPGEGPVIVVAFAWSPDRWLEAWQRRTGGDRPAGLGFIAVGEHERHAAAGGGPGWSSHPQHFDVVSVPHPGNLTDVGVAMTRLLSKWTGGGDRVAVCVRSLTPLLMHTDLRRTYRFLSIMTGQVQTSDAVAHYHLDPATCDEETASTLVSLFDAVLELEPDGGWTTRRQ